MDHENIVQKLTSLLSVAIVVKRDIAAEQSEMIDTAHTVLHKFINDRGNIGSAQSKETIIVKLERADENARFGFGIGFGVGIGFGNRIGFGISVMYAVLC